ncbi:MAG: nucleotidyl transferase AbiEii/AbiGii toxin family protein [Chloroflexi bacterium]|nr:nucleotidyl transferase AbiEii/AbiGii toxin family protein [Chloroflexota bacterium]
MDLHWETITPLMRQVLAAVGRSELCPDFYLAGGTALALQLGHRRSVDLDFFSEHDEVRPEMHQRALRALSSFAPQVVEQAWGNLVLLLGDLRAGFFGYGYPLIAPTIEAEGVPLASLADIGLMKLDAIATRASRKDFCDLYLIAQSIPLRALLDMAPAKYPTVRDFEAMIVRQLAYFERADLEPPLDALLPLDWAEVKGFFRTWARLLGQSWLA